MEELDDYERRFRRAGLPLLIEGWSAREDALPRAFPLLAIVFVGELLGALNLSWSPLANLGAFAAGLGLTLFNFLWVIPHFAPEGVEPFAGR